MAHTYKFLLTIICTTALVLSACKQTSSGPRVELPQTFALQTNSISEIFETKSGQIAAARADGNLVIVNQTGKDPIEITKDARERLLKDRSGVEQQGYTMPIWSPDGKQVAVLEVRYTSPITSQVTILRPYGAQVAMGRGSIVQERSPFGSAQAELTQTNASEYQPFRLTMDFGGAQTSSALYIVEPTGKSVMKEAFYSEAPVQFADWSPDGKQLAVLTRGQEGEKFTLMDADGNNRREIETGVGTRWSWHPDGNSLILQSFISPDSPRTNINILDSETGEVLTRVASRENFPISMAQYSPDGNHILISQPGENGTFDLKITDREGQPIKKLRTFQGVLSYAWSPAGAQMAFVVRETEKSLGGPLRLLDVNTGKVSLLTQFPVAGFFWSPNGETIAAFSPVEELIIDPNFPGLNLLPQRPLNPMMLQTIDVKTRAARQLMYFDPTEQFSEFVMQSDRFARAITIWSPNSRHLVVPIRYAFQGSMIDLIVESESTGSLLPRGLVPGAMAVWSPR